MFWSTVYEMSLKLCVWFDRVKLVIIYTCYLSWNVPGNKLRIHSLHDMISYKILKPSITCSKLCQIHCFYCDLSGKSNTSQIKNKISISYTPLRFPRSNGLQQIAENWTYVHLQFHVITNSWKELKHNLLFISYGYSKKMHCNF